MAAAVAAITAGFEGDEHIPKEAMFVIGAKSVMFSMGLPDKNVFLEGFAIRGHGVVPKVQLIIAEEVT